MTQRPPTERHTFGFGRTEVLVAQGNGFLLFGGAVVVIVEAIRRFGSAHDVSASGVLVVGTLGLIVNLVSPGALFRHAHGHMNLPRAFWHPFATPLGSFVVIAAGARLA